MKSFNRVFLLVFFFATFLFAERNPLLNLEMDKTQRGIIDIGVNDIEAESITTYIKELVAAQPDTRTYPKEIELTERNITREDCFQDQFGVNGCGVAAVDCQAQGETLDTSSIDHLRTISGVSKVEYDKQRTVPIDIGTTYDLNNAKAAIPPTWTYELLNYPRYAGNNTVYTYTFYASHSTTYDFKFMANGQGAMWVDGVKKLDTYSAATRGSSSVYLTRGNHTVQFRANAPVGDPYQRFGATIARYGTVIWNSLKGQTTGLSYYYTVLTDVRTATSCSYANYCSTYANMINPPSTWRTINFYSRYSGTHRLYAYIGSGTGAINIDGVRRVNAPIYNTQPTFYLAKGWHTIQYYGNAGTAHIAACGTWAKDFAMIRMYNPYGSQFWNAKTCQTTDDYFSTGYTHYQPNTYSFNLAKASIPPAWTGILETYPINFTDNVNKTFKFYAMADGDYTFYMKSYVKGDLFVDGNFAVGTTDFRLQKATTLTLSRGEHTITFNGTAGGGYSGWATTIYNGGTMIWNTIQGQVGTKTGSYIEDYKEYVCPDGFTDTVNDPTTPGETCSKTYTWREYECPTGVDAQGMSWIGPLVNAGGDCGGFGTIDGGDCPGQPPIVVENCAKEVFVCPIDPNIACFAQPNSEETQNIINGYEYVPGVSKEHAGLMKELKDCPEAQNNIYFCPSGWEKTSFGKNCTKLLTEFDKAEGHSEDDCQEGYVYSLEFDMCIRTNPFSRKTIAQDEELYYYMNQKIGYDDTKNVCISNKNTACQEVGFNWDADLGKCIRSKACEGLVSEGVCYEKPVVSCPIGLSYNLLTKSCESQVQCAIGILDSSSNLCTDSSMSCPNGMTFNEDILKCEKEIIQTAPGCPEPEMVYFPDEEVCVGEADMTSWNQSGTGTWVVNSTLNLVTQQINATDTFFYSDREYKASIFKGTFTVHDTGDDDWAGITFGYKNYNDAFVFDWKKSAQDAASAGFRLYHQGPRPTSCVLMAEAGCGQEILKTNYPYGGWVAGQSYEMEITFTPFFFEAKIDGVVVLTHLSVDPIFPEEGHAGFFNSSQAQVEYKDFIITTQFTCDPGFTINAAYGICYKEEIDPSYDYNFASNIIYADPLCPPGGTLNTSTNKCEYEPMCPIGSSMNTEGTMCETLATWECSNTDWTYISTPSLFADFVGSCEVPTFCPDGSVEELIGSIKYCTSMEIINSCEAGYVDAVIDGQNLCIASPSCDNGWREEDVACEMKYFWQDYSCDLGWDGPIAKAVGDCEGSCGYYGCNCDNPIPPANNCKREDFGGGTGTLITKKRPLGFHNITGETMDVTEFGTMRGQLCSIFPEDCANYIDEIRGDGNKLCFKKSKMEKETCFEVDGCSFYGNIIPKKQISDTINIQAIDNSFFDYGTIDDQWDSYGFSIGRHALLLSDGNWYVAQDAPYWRGCGYEYINGIGGSGGFKTIPNANYKINVAEPASRCKAGSNEIENDCAIDIDITLPDDLSLISISDLESVVTNVFDPNEGCTGDNAFNEKFQINYDVVISRVGTGLLSDTSFEDENGATVIGDGYGHDIIHNFTLTDNHTISGGESKRLGYKGKPSCGIYQYDPLRNECITPVNYADWTESGSLDASWSWVNDKFGEQAMMQNINTVGNTFYISPFEFDSYVMEGKVGVSMGSGDVPSDDDTIGLIFGYKNVDNFYGVLWSADMRGRHGNTCPWYNNLSLVGTTGRTYQDYCCNFSNTIEEARCGGTGIGNGGLGGGYNGAGVVLVKMVEGVLTVLDTLPNNSGWTPGVYADFKIESDEAGIKVYKDGMKIFDKPNESAPQGKAGYFGVSQDKAYYKGFTVSKKPVCTPGTILDINADQCKETSCPDGYLFNPTVGLCQQVIKSTCALNGHMGWKDRTGGVVSVGSSKEEKSFITLEVPGTADFKDGTTWEGFNQATMAIRLSDGYWYVSSYLKDIDGNDYATTRSLPSKVRIMNPSYYIDLEDIEGNKAPILCKYQGIDVLQTICSRKVKIVLPEFGLKVEAIADIQSLHNIMDRSQTFNGVVDNEFTNYKFIANGSIEHVYSGVGQMSEAVFAKGETQIATDSILDINDRLRFWDSYEDGYVGFLEFTRGVKPEDQADGFIPEIPTPFELNSKGFTSISSLTETDGYIQDGDKTYFIRPYVIGAFEDTCEAVASEYNLAVHSGSFGDEETTKIAKVHGAFNEGACILSVDGFLSQDSVIWGIKNEYTTAGFKFVCSEYECQSDGFCEAAICPTDYQGGLYPENYNLQYPNLIPPACELDACDTQLPFEPLCGQETVCDTSKINVIEIEDGSCQEIYCEPTTGYFNPTTGLCEKMECPSGTIETPEGDCVKP